MTPAEEARMTAYHEAGHAVLAVILDLGPGRVTIEGDGVNAGVALDEGDDPRDEDAQALYSCAPEAFRMRHAAGYYAGAHATRRAGYLNWRDGAHQDYEAAHHVLDDFAPDEETVDALAKLCERRAELLVECYWPEIEALALALVEHGTIEVDEVRAIVAKSLRARKAHIRVW